MWKIPLFDTGFDQREIDAVEKVIRSGWVTMGEVTQTFEQRFAEYIGAAHAIAVASCTAALHLAHRGLDVGAGDEVICPSLTFVAGANSVRYLGARPVFADIVDTSNLCVSPRDIESRITARTRLIQVMHYAGYPCDMPEIARVARAHSLRIVEDCAHAPGATLGGRRCGSLGDVGCFSFYSNKNMTTAEGGMITTDDGDLAARIRRLRSHGMTTATLDRHKGHAFDYDVTELGYNYRIDDIRAAIGLVQLDKLESNNARRGQIDRWYKEHLAVVRDVEVPFLDAAGESAHHIFPLMLPAGTPRRAFIEGMRSRGIQTSVHYPPVHLLDVHARRGGATGPCLGVTEEVAARVVSLPLYPGMQERDVELVCRAVSACLG